MLAVLLSDNADRQPVNRHKYIHAAAQVFLQPVQTLVKKQFSAPYIYYYLQNFYPDQIVMLVNQPERSPVSARFFANVQKYLSKNTDL